MDDVLVQEPTWTVLRYMGSDRYDIVGHSVKAETREDAALKVFSEKRRQDDPEAWTLMVLSRGERNLAVVSVHLRPEVKTS